MRDIVCILSPALEREKTIDSYRGNGSATAQTE